MAVKTTRTLLEQINEALKGKIVYWVENNKTEYGQILQIDKRGFAVISQNGLPNHNPTSTIKIVDIDQAMLGVLEVSSLN